MGSTATTSDGFLTWQTAKKFEPPEKKKLASRRAKLHPELACAYTEEHNIVRGDKKKDKKSAWFFGQTKRRTRAPLRARQIRYTLSAPLPARCSLTHKKGKKFLEKGGSYFFFFHFYSRIGFEFSCKVLNPGYLSYSSSEYLNFLKLHLRSELHWFSSSLFRYLVWVFFLALKNFICLIRTEKSLNWKNNDKRFVKNCAKKVFNHWFDLEGEKKVIRKYSYKIALVKWSYLWAPLH